MTVSQHRTTKDPKEYTDQQLICALRHGWSVGPYGGHGIGDASDRRAGMLTAEIRRRGLEPPKDGYKMHAHTDECPPPAERVG